MTNWEHTLQLEDVWTPSDEDSEFDLSGHAQIVARAIADRLKDIRIKDNTEKNEWAAKFRVLASKNPVYSQEFDTLMDAFRRWAERGDIRLLIATS